MNIEEYRASKKVVKKLVLKKKIKRMISKFLVLIILFLLVLILIKKDNDFKNKIIKYVYEDNFKFTKFKNIYDKYFGKILSIDKLVPKEEKVFNEKLSYNKANVYKDGVVLRVDKGAMIPNLEAGIVVYMGEKQGYGNTVIIEQVDGVDVWYCNINTSGIKMYDYVDKGKLLGEVNGNKLYMVFQKEGKFLDYKEFI